jgi:hypothetical protein
VSDTTLYPKNSSAAVKPDAKQNAHPIDFYDKKFAEAMLI